MSAPIEHAPAVLAVFALTYVGIAIGRIPGLKLNRVGIALLGAIAVMILSGRSAAEIASSVNWPTIFLLFGFFVISAQLRLSGLYDWIAGRVLASMANPERFLLVLIGATAGLSAVLNHDIVCYVLTPVVGTAFLSKKVNPVPYLVAVAAASNIGAAATLIGNAQDMMIAVVAGLSFRSYMLWSFVPVVFGLVGTYAFARAGRGAGPPTIDAAELQPAPPKYPLNLAHAVKGLVILAAVIALFFTPLPKEIVVLVAAGIHLASPKFRTDEMLALVDWPILVMFLCLFVVSGAFQATGYGEQMLQWLVGVGFNPARPGNEAALTAGLSALIGNAPAVMVLIKIVPLAHASAAYIMALANSFGGNLILTASVSNLVVVEQAKHQGIDISFRDFFKLGLPIALVSLLGLTGWAVLVGR
ncbi:MAG: SLC13 family permease [Opitutaceae bacterium]|jgi:Na+/H+ antiporter NhaD/arsenite permease-like protein